MVFAEGDQKCRQESPSYGVSNPLRSPIADKATPHLKVRKYLFYLIS